MSRQADSKFDFPGHTVVCVVCCKKQLSTTTALPTTNMRLTYEGIGIYVDDWSFAIVFL
jgi:hypothetical protein